MIDEGLFVQAAESIFLLLFRGGFHHISVGERERDGGAGSYWHTVGKRSERCRGGSAAPSIFGRIRGVLAIDSSAPDTERSSAAEPVKREGEILDLEQTLAIYRQLTDSRCQDSFDELIDAAMCYAQIRVEWLRAEPASRSDVDATRSRAHDAFIDTCDIMSRQMDLAGEDNTWRAAIGTDRRDIGDFACRLHCVLGILAR
jgi:hypothetical protein